MNGNNISSLSSFHSGYVETYKYKEKILNKYEPLCRSWAFKMMRKYKYMGDLREDLEQEARLIVWKVLDRWDSRLSKLGTYAKIQFRALERDFVVRRCRFEGVCVAGVWPVDLPEGEIDGRYIYEVWDDKAARDLDVKLDMVVKALGRLNKFEREIIISKVINGTGFASLKKLTGRCNVSNQKLVEGIINKARG
jgi:DNA-directed RNA polymerase specialized sigma24 family protein